MKSFLGFLILFVSLIFVFVTPISAMQTRGDYSHANEHQKFKSANKFYTKMVSNDLNTYTEYPNASMNIRVLILYKDLPGLLQNKLGIYERFVPLESIKKDTKIHSKRQLYFYLTSRESIKKSEFKYTAIDAETGIGTISGSASADH